MIFINICQNVTYDICLSYFKYSKYPTIPNCKKAISSVYNKIYWRMTKRKRVNNTMFPRSYFLGIPTKVLLAKQRREI